MREVRIRGDGAGRIEIEVADEVVRNLCAIGGRRAVRGDLETPVALEGIGHHDLPTEQPGHLVGDRALSHGGRTEDGGDARHAVRGHVAGVSRR